ncbi:uncharacterized protein BDZ99DRAFT_499180, partial [Mytilinidion resinicola]
MIKPYGTRWDFPIGFHLVACSLRDRLLFGVVCFLSSIRSRSGNNCSLTSYDNFLVWCFNRRKSRGLSQDNGTSWGSMLQKCITLVQS